MQMNEDLIKQITDAVLAEIKQKKDAAPAPAAVPSMAGRERINEVKTSYASYPRAAKGSDPKEVVIGVGAAFQKEILKTICGIPLDDVLKNVKAGIEEEGMVPRVVKILDTSDVCFMALEAAKLSGSGIGIGIQSKGTTVIHQKDFQTVLHLLLMQQRHYTGFQIRSHIIDRDDTGKSHHAHACPSIFLFRHNASGIILSAKKVTARSRNVNQ